MPAVEILIDDAALKAALAVAGTRIDQIVDDLAATLQDNLEREAGPVSSRVAASFATTGSGSDERRVSSSEFIATFLARGTRDHGPVSAPRLAFAIDGRFVRPLLVRGVRANPFDRRAVTQTEAAAPSIIARALEGIA